VIHYQVKNNTFKQLRI